MVPVGKNLGHQRSYTSTHTAWGCCGRQDKGFPSRRFGHGAWNVDYLSKFTTHPIQRVEQHGLWGRPPVPSIFQPIPHTPRVVHRKPLVRRNLCIKSESEGDREEGISLRRPGFPITLFFRQDFCWKENFRHSGLFAIVYPVNDYQTVICPLKQHDVVAGQAGVEHE